MVDTGVTIKLLTKNLVDMHVLTMKEKSSKYISSVNSVVVQILGTTSITMLLPPWK